MDSYTLADHKNLHSSTLCGHWIPSRRLTESNGEREREWRESVLSARLDDHDEDRQRSSWFVGSKLQSPLKYKMCNSIVSLSNNVTFTKTLSLVNKVRSMWSVAPYNLGLCWYPVYKSKLGKGLNLSILSQVPCNTFQPLRINFYLFIYCGLFPLILVVFVLFLSLRFGQIPSGLLQVKKVRNK